MIEIIRGAAQKEVSTGALIKALQEYFAQQTNDPQGLIYVGYPILSTVIGGVVLDVVLITQKHGILVFDLVEDVVCENRSDIRDSLFLNTQSRLIQHADLMNGRHLGVDLNVLTYASQISSPPEVSKDFLVSDQQLKERLDEISNENNEKYFVQLTSVVQAVTKLNSVRKRQINKPDSRGAKLKNLESSIANLDSRQNRAVIETVNGPQRIRGLAGSGKTIILALKAAYLHARYSEWNIAITFNTRSLKEQFKELVTKFTIEQKHEDPDWSKIKIVQSWGSHVSSGIYYDFCVSHGIEPLDFRTAKIQTRQHGNRLTPLGYACALALQEMQDKKIPAQPKYDAILIDEAQDLSPAFLKLCYRFLKTPKRIIWAYDDLQNLSMLKMQTPKELFGVELSNDEGFAQQDIILKCCYRNSRPVLVSAHGLGFGTARKNGLVQMFDNPTLWTEIGYEVASGNLEAGQNVVLGRTKETSPSFLESELESNSDLIQFKSFDTSILQAEWVANEIKKNLEEEELTIKDIIVITLDAKTAENDTALLRAKLYEYGIATHLAGVTTSPDQFFQEDSIACTGIYRAKGNEAAMVYVINSEYSFEGPELISKRNMLFSAITRSKAWVRVTGCGLTMKGLIEEFEIIKNSDFNLSFKYPGPEEMEQIRQINRDLTVTEKQQRNKALENIKNIAESFKKGTITSSDISSEIREQLKTILSDKTNEPDSK